MLVLATLINVIYDLVSRHLELFIKLVGAIVALITSYYIGVFISKLIIGRIKVRVAPEVLISIRRGIRILFTVIGLLASLSIIGIDLTGILVAAGFAGIVVGLALQQTLSQVFSGLLLLIEGRVKVGDAIRIGDDWGLVESIGIASTQIRLWSGEILTVPNTTVASSNIYNYSRSIARRAEFTLGISYSSDINRALEVIRRVLWNNSAVLAEPEPVIIVDSIGDSAINIKVMYWAPSQLFWNVRSTVIAEVKKALEETGVEIPFPQRVVWLKK
ncbi:MAG: mechanosensitive ion channel family protein [Sulfolobales archaeon]|nr:mechanosensitive ion channel family protein [Sulfolobales archaeon]